MPNKVESRLGGLGKYWYLGLALLAAGGLAVYGWWEGRTNGPDIDLDQQDQKAIAQFVLTTRLYDEDKLNELEQRLLRGTDREPFVPTRAAIQVTEDKSVELPVQFQAPTTLAMQVPGTAGVGMGAGLVIDTQNRRWLLIEARLGLNPGKAASQGFDPVQVGQLVQADLAHEKVIAACDLAALAKAIDLMGLDTLKPISQQLTDDQLAQLPEVIYDVLRQVTPVCEATAELEEYMGVGRNIYDRTSLGEVVLVEADGWQSPTLGGRPVYDNGLTARVVQNLGEQLEGFGSLQALGQAYASLDQLPGFAQYLSEVKVALVPAGK